MTDGNDVVPDRVRRVRASGCIIVHGTGKRRYVGWLTRDMLLPRIHQEQHVIPTTFHIALCVNTHSTMVFFAKPLYPHRINSTVFVSVNFVTQRLPVPRSLPQLTIVVAIAQ